jgi:hypothetical protein
VVALHDHAVHVAVQPRLPLGLLAGQVGRRRHADVAAKVGGVKDDHIKVGGARDRDRGHAVADAQVPAQPVPVGQPGPGGHDLLGVHWYVDAFGEPRPAAGCD